jgi:hypothetical protein
LSQRAAKVTDQLRREARGLSGTQLGSRAANRHGGARSDRRGREQSGKAVTTPVRRRRVVRRHGQRVIATGVSDNHARAAQRVLLDSVLQGDGPQRVVVYDLGLSPRNAAAIAAHPAVLELRKFDFGTQPRHMRMTRERTRGQYAWKAVIVGELLREYDAVLWLDAGTAIPRREAGGAGSVLTPLFTRLHDKGVLSAHSKEDVGTWTHPGTLAKLARATAARRGASGAGAATFPRELLSRGNCNGAIIGFARHHAAYAAVFQPWLACAREEACIAPPGSSRANHRQDQAVLSALVALAGPMYSDVCADEPGYGTLAGWRTHQDGTVPAGPGRRARRRA